MQFQIGSDAVMCLDDCTDATASPAELEASVERTIRWARTLQGRVRAADRRVARAEAPPHCFSRSSRVAPTSSFAPSARASWWRSASMATASAAGRSHPAATCSPISSRWWPALSHTTSIRRRARHRATGSPRLGLDSASTRSIAVCRPATPDAVDCTSTDPILSRRARRVGLLRQPAHPGRALPRGAWAGRSELRLRVLRRASRGPTCSTCSRWATRQANASPRSTTCASTRGCSISCAR